MNSQVLIKPNQIALKYSNRNLIEMNGSWERA